MAGGYVADPCFVSLEASIQW